MNLFEANFNWVYDYEWKFQRFCDKLLNNHTFGRKCLKLKQSLEDFDKKPKGFDFGLRVECGCNSSRSFSKFITLGVTARFVRLRASLRIQIKNHCIPRWSAWKLGVGVGQRPRTKWPWGNGTVALFYLDYSRLNSLGSGRQKLLTKPFFNRSERLDTFLWFGQPHLP